VLLSLVSPHEVNGFRLSKCGHTFPCAPICATHNVALEPCALALRGVVFLNYAVRRFRRARRIPGNRHNSTMPQHCGRSAALP